MQKSTKILIAQERVFERRLQKSELEAEKLLAQARKEAEKTTLAIKKEVDLSLAEEIASITQNYEDSCTKLEELTSQRITRVDKKQMKLLDLTKSLTKEFVEEVLAR